MKNKFLNLIEDFSRLFIAIGLLILSIACILLMFKINDIFIENIFNSAYYFLISGLAIELLNLISFSKIWSEPGACKIIKFFPVSANKEKENKSNLFNKWKKKICCFCLFAFIIAISFGIKKNAREKREDRESLAGSFGVSNGLFITVKNSSPSSLLAENITDKLNKNNFLNVVLLSSQDCYNFNQSYIFYPSDYKKEAEKIYAAINSEFILEEDKRLANEIEIIIGSIASSQYENSGKTTRR